MAHEQVNWPCWHYLINAVRALIRHDFFSGFALLSPSRLLTLLILLCALSPTWPLLSNNHFCKQSIDSLCEALFHCAE